MFIPDSNFFHPGSRIRIFPIPDSGSASKNLSILIKKRFLSSGNAIRVVHPRSGFRRVPILIFYISRIRNTGSSFWFVRTRTFTLNRDGKTITQKLRFFFRRIFKKLPKLLAAGTHNINIQESNKSRSPGEFMNVFLCGSGCDDHSGEMSNVVDPDL
jgi:hypothetical protein